MLHNKEWKITEYRMGRGREYRYTLAYIHSDGTCDIIRLSEKDITALSYLKGALDIYLSNLIDETK